MSQDFLQKLTQYTKQLLTFNISYKARQRPGFSCWENEKINRDVSTTLDGSLRIQKQARPALGGLHLAKPRLRSVINSLTFIVTRTIRHKGKDGKLAFLPLPLASTNVEKPLDL